MSIQHILNIIISKLTLNPLIFILAGILQHLILDNLIQERPINIFNKTYKDYLSLILAILGICIAFNVNTPLTFKIGLYASLMPDILEGLRLLTSSNAKDLWYSGDSQRFHINLDINWIDTRDNFKLDILRRIVLIMVSLIIMGGFKMKKIDYALEKDKEADESIIEYLCPEEFGLENTLDCKFPQFIDDDKCEKCWNEEVKEQWFCDYCKEYHDKELRKYLDENGKCFCSKWHYYNKEEE